MADNPHKISKIIGPPGTGKSTRVLALIAKACERYDPERIGAISYTNSAVNTIRERIARTTGVSPDAAENAKTLHSHCFKLLELKKDDVADTKIEEWNEAYPQWELPLRFKPTEEEGDIVLNSHQTMENRMFFAEMQLLRNRMVPKDKWPAYVREFWEDWKWWMEMNGYIDFTGMLEEVAARGLHPPIDILFIDEAQDASHLMFEILRQWSEHTISTLYVGDSDQAIFRWNGASPEGFMGLEATYNKVLEQSYRVPKAVHRYAMQVISQAKDREVVQYEPTEMEGEFFGKQKEPDLGLDGTHMIIARCQHQLNRWRTYLKFHGIPWHNPYRPEDTAWNPLNSKTWRAAQTYVTLKNGEDVSRGQFSEMIKLMKVKGNLLRGVKTAISDLTLPRRISAFELGSLRVFEENFLFFEKPVTEVINPSGVAGEFLFKVSEQDVLKEPEIIIGTCHSVKGGESDHVWLDMGTSTQIEKAITYSKTGRDDEVRVAYVAATRAKETLGLLTPQGMENSVIPKDVE